MPPSAFYWSVLNKIGAVLSKFNQEKRLSWQTNVFLNSGAHLVCPPILCLESWAGENMFICGEARQIEGILAGNMRLYGNFLCIQPILQIEELSKFSCSLFLSKLTLHIIILSTASLVSFFWSQFILHYWDTYTAWMCIYFKERKRLFCRLL